MNILSIALCLSRQFWDAFDCNHLSTSSWIWLKIFLGFCLNFFNKFDINVSFLQDFSFNNFSLIFNLISSYSLHFHKVQVKLCALSTTHFLGDILEWIKKLFFSPDWHENNFAKSECWACIKNTTMTYFISVEKILAQAPTFTHCIFMWMMHIKLFRHVHNV